MNSPGNQRKHAPRCLILGNLCFLVAYLFSLCTLSPQVHAETLRHAAHPQPAVADHCSRPATTSATARHAQPRPLCCEVRGGSNKATLKSAPALNARVLAGFLFLPMEGNLPQASDWVYCARRCLRLLHPPPLYLLYETFLI
jgi:hypothetical protein